MKLEVFLIILILFSGIVSAENIVSPTNTGSPLVDTAATNSPYKVNPNTGQIEFNMDMKTSAEKRIIAVNNWFKEKTPWMKYVFGMNIEISWTFIFIFLVWFFFLSLFVVVLPKWILFVVFVFTDIFADSLKTYKTIKNILPLAGLGALFLLVFSEAISSLAQIIGGTSRSGWGNLIVTIVVIVVIAILFILDKIGSEFMKRSNKAIMEEEIIEKSKKEAKKVAEKVSEEHHGKDLEGYGDSWVSAEESKKEQEEIAKEAEDEVEMIKAQADKS